MNFNESKQGSEEGLLEVSQSCQKVDNSSLSWKKITIEVISNVPWVMLLLAGWLSSLLAFSSFEVLALAPCCSTSMVELAVAELLDSRK